MHQVFLNEPDDIRWLVDVHLKRLSPPEFKSAVITGNEDCPAVVELYKSNMPRVTTKPMKVYHSNERGELCDAD